MKIYSDNITDPLTRGINEANTIQDVENVLDETVKSDKTIKNRTFAEFMQDGQIQYDKLTEKFGDNLLGIKEAIVKNDRSLLDEICARQAAAEKLIKDIADELTKTTDEAKFAENFISLRLFGRLSFNKYLQLILGFSFHKFPHLLL